MTRVRRALESLQTALADPPENSWDLSREYSAACSLAFADAVEALEGKRLSLEASERRWDWAAACRRIGNLEELLAFLLETARDQDQFLNKLRGAKGRRPAKRALALLAVNTAKALARAGHKPTTNLTGKLVSVLDVVLREAGGRDEEMPEHLVKRAVAAVRKSDPASGKGMRRNPYRP